MKILDRVNRYLCNDLSSYIYERKEKKKYSPSRKESRWKESGGIEVSRIKSTGEHETFGRQARKTTSPIDSPLIPSNDPITAPETALSNTYSPPWSVFVRISHVPGH